jgi:Flp pilus assembly pilin Flp
MFNRIGDYIMRDFLRRLWHEEKGQDLTEYALLLVLLALAAVATMGNLATVIRDVFNNAANTMKGATSTPAP